MPSRGLPTAVKIVRTYSAPNHPEGYALTIRKNSIEIHFREIPGLRAATATLRQLFREYGTRLPCLRIRDWPDFARRGVMTVLFGMLYDVCNFPALEGSSFECSVSIPSMVK